MSSPETTTLSTASTAFTAGHRRSYRCYHCDHAFHITTTATATAASSSSSASASFRCPRCYIRHILPHYTVAVSPPTTPTPVAASNSNSTPPSYDRHNNSDSFTLYSSDSDSDWSDSEDSFFEFHSSQTRPSTLKSFVESLPAVDFDFSDSVFKTCPICMDEFEIRSEVSQLPCMHMFHRDCIVAWLDRSNTCPLCRHKLPEEPEKKAETIPITFELIATMQNRGLVASSTSSSSSAAVAARRMRLVRSLSWSESGEDDGGDDGDVDVRGSGVDEMRDEDGDTLMVDAL